MPGAGAAARSRGTQSPSRPQISPKLAGASKASSAQASSFASERKKGECALRQIAQLIGSGSVCAVQDGASSPISFQIATDDQEETDRYWNAIVGNGGKESECGWCKDRWGLSWQITPRVLTEALAAGGDEAKRAFEAMRPMKKIHVATIRQARRS